MYYNALYVHKIIYQINSLQIPNTKRLDPANGFKR